MYKLIGTIGQNQYSFELEPGQHIIGRDTKSDISIDNGMISRRHAEIMVSDDSQSIYIEDIGSSNGTFVNDEKIASPTIIKPGNSIKFGHIEFQIVSSAAGSNSLLTNENAQQSVVISVDEMLKSVTPESLDTTNLIKTTSSMAKMLIGDESQEELLCKSLELISGLIPADRLAVLFVSSDYEEIEVAATKSKGGGDLGSFNLSKTIINNVITNKNAVLICDPVADSRFAEAQSIIMSNLKSAMAVPLFDEQKVLGILYADTVKPLVKYTNEHLRIMAIFGNIIASKISNLTLLSEREERRFMEREMERAADIQNNLLVKEIPQVDGFEIDAFQKQSQSVGGDLYDVKALPDGKLLFLVADVSGKGLGAAILMSNILASLRIVYDLENLTLEQLVKRVSLQLHKFTDPEAFATMFIGIADNQTGEIKYVNAGHNAPFMIRAEGETELIEPTGIMIGAFDFVDWTTGEIMMSPGDQLLIYSDGLPDAQRDDILFGDERLQKLAERHASKKPTEFLREIMRDIDDYVGDAPQFDDMTLMALKRDQS